MSRFIIKRSGRVDVSAIKKCLLKKEDDIVQLMPDKTDQSIRRAMRLIAFEVGKIFKEVLQRKDLGHTRRINKKRKK